ncbi:gliding motility-associated ABC transporter ATP-binding subunit GldA [Chryseolinea lacunae]|uniref:Gliding motility-associated ABC transporter ATP-binding subunit GldA n=1 Tax=Chryseolinea lacunae TaxID=2801331 RepID=A0ABS1KPT2_9BACT|nr:gliding motility-associated ABC transporter ATP-binding subunit GldA [Chryseolinea lacunae]MBL0741237.1 gliding motility-associated ABC transporter ATP-binding subunit GldA [Chryseolinea lacunae]
MSLAIHQLTKIYGEQKAINNISFTVREGEIVGFLGPNGAGKSSTMKIATGYLPPTAGRVVVGGFDVMEQPMKVKQITGYLPEHNPLYLDLYVHEYLQFIGSLYGLSGNTLKQRTGEIIELCGLGLEQNKRIEALSKGYRQRVGLAQALIHDPRVLILDEPTSGLDPNQLAEIRKLIKDISRNKTVIFSTHIMQEVQALCDRVVVINKGEIVADNSLDALLRQQGNGQTLLAEFEGNVTAAQLGALKGVQQVAVVEGFRFRITTDGIADLRPEIFRFAADNNLSLIGLKQEESSLENIFRELTAAPVSPDASGVTK